MIAFSLLARWSFFRSIRITFGTDRPSDKNWGCSSTVTRAQLRKKGSIVLVYLLVVESGFINTLLAGSPSIGQHEDREFVPLRHIQIVTMDLLEYRRCALIIDQGTMCEKGIK